MPNVRSNSSRGRGRPSRSEVLGRELTEAEAVYVSFVKVATLREHTLIMSQVELQSIWGEIESQFSASEVDKGIATALIRRYADVERSVAVASDLFNEAEKSRLVAYQAMEQKRAEFTNHLIASA
jgi:hypothetical protein